ncbi:RusA family crossover junction endodeoxyribonuclease [Listeria booriae]|uniref:RusA family crossover junction endodeoxyribonuclease n=1 Tax=Listeria booriae TaxID=1552123 RepID=UPI002880401B|nr:RusA family crossover junction endodeoxyribonuclease [Listeria booriae]MDT0112455.1 RusA family crossover junction endodeoxyribonuclease [Listeria booriae]
MFRAVYQGRPKPAERARVRFSTGNKTYYMHIPETYRAYQNRLKEFFSQYAEDPDLKELFRARNLIYGLSIKLVFRLKGRGQHPFYQLRPDIDNLYKAVTDALFLSDVNIKHVGFEEDEEGNKILDNDGNPIETYKQKIDDSRVVHAELLKLRVDTEEEEQFTIVIRNVAEEDIQ